MWPLQTPKPQQRLNFLSSLCFSSEVNSRSTDIFSGPILIVRNNNHLITDWKLIFEQYLVVHVFNLSPIWQKIINIDHLRNAEYQPWWWVRRSVWLIIWRATSVKRIWGRLFCLRGMFWSIQAQWNTEFTSRSRAVKVRRYTVVSPWLLLLSLL